MESVQGELPRSAGFRGRGQPLLTRRDVLVGAFAAGGLMGRRTSFAKASQPATAVKFEVPANACDCHTHIFGHPDQFPYWPGRTYTPEIALPEEMSALHRALHIDRVVIVTPSVYGTDNSATFFGMQARGANARIAANADRILWGTDWPHPTTSGQRRHIGVIRGLLRRAIRSRELHVSLARPDQHIRVYATLAAVYEKTPESATAWSTWR